MKATLTKRVTDDGVDFIKDDVPIGTLYEVDEKSVQLLSWYDKRTEKITPRPCILVFTSYHKDFHGVKNSVDRPGWLPLELFNLEAD
jgi:hypothetical protein